MPQFDEYERGGRRLMIEFTCRRCEGTRVEPLEPLVDNDTYGYLHNIKLPEGWTGFVGFPMCPTCTKELKEFMAQGVNDALRKEPIP